MYAYVASFQCANEYPAKFGWLLGIRKLLLVADVTPCREGGGPRSRYTCAIYIYIYTMDPVDLMQ